MSWFCAFSAEFLSFSVLLSLLRSLSYSFELSIHRGHSLASVMSSAYEELTQVSSSSFLVACLLVLDTGVWTEPS